MQSKDELVFVLKGVQPEQLSIGRLAAYMKEFASLLGSPDRSFFSGVRNGSTCIAAKLAPGEIGKARSRVFDASKGFAPAEATNAYEKLAQMAENDQLAARVVGKTGTVIHFPRGSNKRTELSVFERGHVTGRLSGIVDDKSGATVRIRPMDGGPLVYASANNKMADSLGSYFRKLVRVYGTGKWTRDDNGRWVCSKMQIDEIHTVEDVNIRQAIHAMRELEIEWAEDPFEGFESASTA
ncbi:MAG: hypothetical protein AAF636_22560 [Pseudomonadota bacterium]